MQKFKRPSLLLAFGEHPSTSCGTTHPANRGFFKAALLPFIDSAKKNGKKVLVIHEMGIGFDVKGLDKRKSSDVRAVENSLRTMEQNANSLFSETLDSGQMLNVARDWFDWGYLDAIVEENSTNPGFIRNLVEPFGADTIWHNDRHDMLFRKSQFPMPSEERVDLEVELIKASIDICLSRSLRLVKFIKQVREEDPDVAIAVPRGYAHRGMADHFDYSEFEITVAYGMRGVPFFSSDAIAESFRRHLSPEELRRFARLSLHFDEYCRNAMREGLEGKDIWDIHTEARQYAFQKDRESSQLATFVNKV